MNNSIDLGRIYGFNDCKDGSCSYTGNVAPNIPSLEEIAYYNIARANIDAQNTQEDYKRQEELQNTLQSGGFRDRSQTMPEQVVDNITARDISYGGLSRSYTTTEQGNDYTLTPKLQIPMDMMNDNSNLNMIPEYNQPYPVTAESIQYLNAFMRTQVGRRVEVEFLIGSDDLVSKTGYLLGVGANYILINELGTANLTSCDFYNIKFVTYFYD